MMARAQRGHMLSSIVVGVDPGFAALGLAAVDITPGVERIIEASVIRTEKSHRKLDVRASDDNVRRATELSAGMCVFCSRFRPIALACEAQSWPRNAGSSAKVGIAWGVVAAVGYRFGIPIVQVSPQQLKHAVVGKKTASKDEVIEAIERRFPAVSWPTPTSIIEHAADAVAAVIACSDSQAIRMAIHLARRERDQTACSPLDMDF